MNYSNYKSNNWQQKVLFSNWRAKVEYYYNLFKEIGLYKHEDELPELNDMWISQMYHHYTNLIDDCAGLSMNKDLMCSWCQDWYYDITEQLKDDEDNVFNGLKVKDLEYLTKLVKAEKEKNNE